MTTTRYHQFPDDKASRVLFGLQILDGSRPGAGTRCRPSLTDNTVKISVVSWRRVDCAAMQAAAGVI